MATTTPTTETTIARAALTGADERSPLEALRAMRADALAWLVNLEQRITEGEAEAAENAASVRAIPQDELPDSPARAALIALAAHGYDVYAYRPAGGGAHAIWAISLRLTCAEWLATYRASAAAQGNQEAQQ